MSETMSHSGYRVSRFVLAVRCKESRRTSVRFRLGSPFPSKTGFATAHLNAKPFWWWQGSVGTVSFFLHLLGSRSTPVPFRGQLSVRQIYSNQFRVQAIARPNRLTISPVFYYNILIQRLIFQGSQRVIRLVMIHLSLNRVNKLYV